MTIKYKLLNPHVEGTFKKVVAADKPADAGKKIWSNLSKHFSNTVPKFYFTLENTETGSLHHIEVGEKIKKNGDSQFVDYIISEYNNPRSKKDIDKFRKNLTKFQEGGKYKCDNDDDDLCDSSESDIYQMAKRYKTTTQPPIYYWWYDPYIYKIDKLYLPSFVVPVTPYVELNLSSAFIPTY